MWSVRLASIVAVVLLVVGCALSQTFQYSRGWTNGKRSGLPPMPSREAACQLHRLRAILEGKNSPQLYWPCDWYSYFDSGTNSRQQHVPQEAQLPLSQDPEEK